MSEMGLSYQTGIQPASGKIIEALQKSYIQHRLEMGNATNTSESEPILYHLRTKGIIAGLPSALNESWKNWFILTPYILSVGAVEFLLISAGIRLWGVGKKGSWHPIDYFSK